MKTLFIAVILSFFTLSISAQNNNCKCCTKQHSEFDFWIGTWEVTNPDGSKAGKNKIEKVQGECVLQESWTSASSGYTGTSNNFYNLKTKQWEQIWIDNQGASLHMKGNKIGDQMILRTDDETNAQGKTFFHRVTWTANEDGTVRQLWETITDKTEVTIAFDGLYKKVE
ncbi:Tetratricopeptide repeat protein [Flavobacteriales bacterium ALC-1]|nr:Tetratricopeptide repeat protein [Flavobacteriales bacterium ALC-1]